MFGGYFFEFLTPSTLGDHNFLNYILFLMIFNAPNVPKGMVQGLFRNHKNGAIPLDLVYPKRRSVRSLAGLPYNFNLIAIQFATKEQLKD
jgi:hypothetical protein